MINKANMLEVSICLTVLLALIYQPTASFAQTDKKEMVKIPSDQFIPFFKIEDEEDVLIESFYMDVYPVSNADFLEFVRKYPKWMKAELPNIFADTGYLKQWEIEDGVLKHFETIRNSPVTNVSWHAANAYCEAQNKRLPTVMEWEYAGSAAILNDDRSLEKIILEWYSKPNPPYIGDVGSGTKNEFGLYDMHGLIWEWVHDFNSIVIDGDSRSNTETLNTKLFCASGSFGASNKEDYASFMRYAYRSSLKSNYTVSNLGFRCVNDLPKQKK